MPVLDQEKLYLREAIEGLEEYLISERLYGGLSLPASGLRTAAMSRLTLGNLLLVLARLRAGCPEGSAFKPELVQLESKIHAAQARWPANWDRKIEQEIPVRLKSWEMYLGEYWQDRPAHARVYPAQVRERAILQLLGDNRTGALSEFRTEIDGLDRRLKVDLVEAPFVWEADLAGGFLPDPYWFLYGRLRIE